MSDWENGFYSDKNLADLRPGSQEWQGAAERDRVNRTRQELGQWQPSGHTGHSHGGGGGDGSAVGLIVIAVVLFAAAALHQDPPSKQRTAVVGQNYRVRPCAFTGAGANSRQLANNEWVHVQEVNGQTLDVAAYRRPYNGSSVRGNISIECLKQ